MPQVDVLPVPTESADLAAWLQLELEIDPAPIVHLAEMSPAGVTPDAAARRCPLCGADLVFGGAMLHCLICGMEIDL